MPPAKTSITWAAPGANGFRWREFDTISVLFDPRSGETHMLDVLSREVLDLISDEPRTSQGVLDAVSSLMPETPEATVKARVDEIVGHFDRIGLIFPAAEGSA